LNQSARLGDNIDRRKRLQISSIPKSSKDMEERMRIIISIQIQDIEGNTRTERALIDSGAEENCVKQALVTECGWTAQDDDISLATVDGREVMSYGTHNIETTGTDSENTTKTHRHGFVACDFNVPDVTFILGYPWLREVDPAISFRAGTWRYPFIRAQISLLSAKRFTKRIRGQAVYCIVAKMITETEKELPTKHSKYIDTFDTNAAGILPEHHPMEHRIDLEPGKSPPWGPVYPLSESELEILREYLQSALAKGWIRRSTSPAGAPILFVPKKGGGLRLCVDYRGLNAVTIKDRTPLPLISETLDRLRRAKVFTKLDLKDAYHRLRIKEGDEWKTAFRTRYGHFEYCVLPFGLSNAPATFQAYINQALVGLVDVTCVVYLDDILVFSEDPTEHTAAVHAVLERLRTYKLYANLKKCEFDTDTVEFLGFIVGPQGISMDPSRVETVRDWPEPTSFRDIQVFLGFTNFYRRFIHRYSKITYPLTEMLKGMESGKKSGPFRLTSEAASAFRELKEHFTRAPMLRHFESIRKIMVETDASKFALGGVLSQLFGSGTESRWHPIAFYSKKLSAVEQRYEVHDGELMAIVFAFKQWRQYLRGASDTIVVRTDHNNLKYFMTKRVLTGRQARWAESLAEFDFVIEYRSGKTNPADGPSRRPDYNVSEPNRSEEDAESCLPTLHNKLRLASMTKWSIPYATNKRFSIGALLTQSGSMRESSSLPLDKKSKGEGAVSTGSGDIRPTGPRHPRTDEMSEALVLDRTCKSHGPKTPCNGVLGVPVLEPVAGAVGCKQRVPREIAVVVLSTETADGTLSEPIRDSLLELQRLDPFVVQKQYEKIPIRLRAGSDVGHWRIRETDGLLCYRGAVYVPTEKAIRSEIIYMNHDDALAGHLGYSKTLELIKRKYFWQSLRKDIKDYVKTCAECQRGKSRRHRPYGELAPIPTPLKPWEEITMDFITDLPPSKKNNQVFDSILVVVDRFTKLARYIAVRKSMDTAELADIFINHIFKDFGCPKGITTDRGSLFTSKFWGTLMWYLQVRRRLSTAFHPQTDGQTEVQNQILEFYLRTYCNYRQDDWTSKLALAEFTYNNSKHSTTGSTPFRLLYGFDPELGTNVRDDVLEGGAPSAEERIKLLMEERTQLSNRLRTAAESHKKYYDAKHKPMRFKVEDKVVIASKNIRQLRPSRKLSDKYLGPFEIVEVIGDHGQAYRVKLPPHYQIHNVFHVSLLEPWHERMGTNTESAHIRVQRQEEYEVKSIQAHRDSAVGREYLVRWKGYGPADDTWEPEDNVVNAPEKVQEYLQNAASRTKGKSKGKARGRA
jgi:hypothetical protein